MRLKDLASPDVISWVLTTVVRLWFGTVRVELRHRERFEQYARDLSLGNIVGVVWHRNAIFLFYFFRTLGPRGVMISRSRDGDIIAAAARRFGYTTMRGSSSRGGTQALRRMIAYLADTREKRLCGTPVDGPRGPARVMKKGMLMLARKAGAVVVPVACSGTRVLTLRKTWDKTMVPLPFSKTVIDFGESFAIPADADRDAMEALRRRVEEELNAMTDDLDRICGLKRSEERNFRHEPF
jgi:lysophospholipid acyltransferase (LPLAT)-like uncharacterized protein